MNTHDLLMNIRLKFDGKEYNTEIDTIDLTEIIKRVTKAYFSLQSVAFDITALDTLRIEQLESTLKNFKAQVMVLQKRMYNLRKGLRDE